MIVLCFFFRWVDDNLDIHESFIGLYPLSTADAASIVLAIKDILLRLSLNISDARGQCYDGASVMSGPHSGVATEFKKINPKCLYTHCYGHALNLAVGDAVKDVGDMAETFDIAKEICKLVKKSPKRDTLLKQLRKTSENHCKGENHFM